MNVATEIPQPGLSAIDCRERFSWAGGLGVASKDGIWNEGYVTGLLRSTTNGT